MHRIPLRVVLALAALLLVAPAAHAASPDLVLNQVFAAGGNSGAAYTNDFAELFNRGGTTVDLTGWTVQYATASGNSWQATPLSGTLEPGRHYLVQLASGGSVGSALPAADATGTSNLAVSGGKLALVHDVAPLTCGASAGSCSASSGVVDLLGYGSATDFEGSGPSPALSATTAAVRAGSGCIDSDSNAADFTTAAPAPLNSATAAATCGAAPPPTGAAVQSAAVDIDIAPVLSIALERPTLSFGSVFAGQPPAPISEKVTVVSNNPAGYSLTVHRAAFTPADLPLGISVDGGALAPVPVAPALDLLIASSNAPSAAAGDQWPTSLGFASLPTVPPGKYTSTVVFTAIGR
jgi:lamin tail-like protein